MTALKHVDEPIECHFCYYSFASFNELADHVQQAHVAPEDRKREEGLPWTDDNMEEDMGLPAPGGGKRPSQREDGRGTARKAPNVPFLGVEDFSSSGEENAVDAKILGVAIPTSGFNDIVVKIKVNNKSYFLGLKASNENYETLFNAFGDDENKWVGEEFRIGLNFNEFYEKNFVHIFSVTEPNGETKKKGKR